MHLVTSCLATAGTLFTWALLQATQAQASPHTDEERQVTVRVVSTGVDREVPRTDVVLEHFERAEDHRWTWAEVTRAEVNASGKAQLRWAEAPGRWRVSLSSPFLTSPPRRELWGSETEVEFLVVFHGRVVFHLYPTGDGRVEVAGLIGKALVVTEYPPNVKSGRARKHRVRVSPESSVEVCTRTGHRYELGGDLSPFFIQPRAQVIGVGQGTQEVDVQLLDAITLFGRVVDAEGLGVRAAVEASALVGNDRTTRWVFASTETDREGHFQLEGTSPHWTALTATSPGHGLGFKSTYRMARVHRGPGEPSTGPFELVLEPNLGETNSRLLGRVYAGKSPATGYQVTARSLSDSATLATATTNMFGGFDFDLVGPRRVLFTIRPSLGGSAIPVVRDLGVGRKYATFELPSGGLRGQALPPDGGSALFIDVIAERRNPVPGVEWETRTFPSIIRADENGHFELRHLEDGVYRLRAQSAPVLGMSPQIELGHSSVVRTVTVTGGEIIDNVEVELDAAGTIVGSIVGPDGNPASAVVHALDSTGRRLHPAAYLTRRAGAFVIPGMPGGTILLEAHTPEWISPSPVAVEARPGETARVTLGLVRAADLKVRIDLDESLDARVSLRSEGGFERARPDFPTVSDTETYSERSFGPLAPGTYTLTVWWKDGERQERELVLGPGDRRDLTISR